MKPSTSASNIRPKTKTGCLTCRARKVKCDEEKPTCLRCRNSRRHCAGYDLQVSFYENVETPPSIPAAEQEQPTQLASQPTAPDFDRDSPDQLFRLLQQAAEQLEIHFHPDIWTEIVLPLAHVEPAVRAALAAITILCQDRSRVQLPTSTTIGAAEMVNPLASTQYFKAIRLLQERIDNQEPTAVVLLTCVLFICYEVLSGNEAGAFSHLRAGLNIKMSYRRSGATDAGIASAERGEQEAEDNSMALSLYRLTGEGVAARDIGPLISSSACMDLLRPCFNS